MNGDLVINWTSYDGVFHSTASSFGCVCVIFCLFSFPVVPVLASYQ